MHLDIMSVLAILGYIVTFAAFYLNQKKEHDETIRELQKIKDTQEEHGRRLDDHNHYAELFAESKDDIAETKANIAYIKGKIENL